MAPEAALLTLSAAKGKPAVELMPPMVITPLDTPGTGNPGRVLKSSWIQRLKPRDEMESVRGDADDYSSDQSLACPSPQLADVVTEASDLMIRRFRDSSRQIRQEDKDLVADRSSKGFVRSGFGPWINLSSATRLLERPFGEPERAEHNSMYALGVSVSPQPCKKFEEKSTTTTSHATPTLNMMHTCSPTVNIAKPPLPPRSKLGLLPRSLNIQQSRCSTSLAGISSPLPNDMAIIDTGTVLRDTFLQGAFVNVSTLQGMEAAEKCKVTELSEGREVAPKCKVTDPSKERLDGMSWNANVRSFNSGRCISEHHDYLSASGRAGSQDNNCLNKHNGIKHVDMNELFAPQCRGAALRGKCTSTKGGNDICEEPNFDAARTNMEKQMGLVGDVNVVKGSGAVLQTSGRDLTAGQLQETALETSHRTISPIGALESAPSSSTTASFPWEMFVESAGASKNAREQFVEVYNKAREELKNQRSPQNFQKVNAKEVCGSPGHAPLRQVAYGGCDVRAQRVYPSLESSFRWSQGNEIFPVTSLGRKTEFSHRVSVSGNDLLKKKQVVAISNSASLVESKAKFLPAGRGNSQAFPPICGATCDIRCEAKNFSQNWQQDLPRPKNPLHTETSNYISLPGAITAPGKISAEEVATSALHARTADVLPGANTVLGKRPHEISEEVAASAVHARRADKLFVTRREKALYKPHVWLQRWQANIYMGKGMEEAEHVQPDGVGQKPDDCCVGPQIDNFKGECFEFSKKGGDIHQNRFSQKRGGSSQMVARDERDLNIGGLPKGLPSAAAMAIVGTAARQFCSTQPQQKGSFAFWSGFGMAASKSTQVLKDKGKGNFLQDTSEPL